MPTPQASLEDGLNSMQNPGAAPVSPISEAPTSLIPVSLGLVGLSMFTKETTSVHSPEAALSRLYVFN